MDGRYVRHGFGPRAKTFVAFPISATAGNASESPHTMNSAAAATVVPLIPGTRFRLLIFNLLQLNGLFLKNAIHYGGLEGDRRHGGHIARQTDRQLSGNTQFGLTCVILGKCSSICLPVASSSNPSR